MAYRVAVLMGGSSFERDFSLASGRHVLRTLTQEGHEVLPLDTSSSLVEVLRQEKPDLAFIALHGGNGEDGTIQSLLEYLGIPFIGSPAGVCRTTYNKSMLPHVLKMYRQRAAQAAGEDVSVITYPASWPQSVCLSEDCFRNLGAATALDLIDTHIPGGYPVAVLPASGGSAMGISRVDRFEDLANAILDALSFDNEVLIEKWISGVELAVSIVGSGSEAYALPPVEICPHGDYFKTEVRLDPNLVDYYAPARLESFSPDVTCAKEILEQIKAAALEVHHSFDCRDLSRVDLYWDGQAVQVLEINVSPGMAEYSLFPMACRAADKSFGSVLNELLDKAIVRD